MKYMFKLILTIWLVLPVISSCSCQQQNSLIAQIKKVNREKKKTEVALLKIRYIKKASVIITKSKNMNKASVSVELLNPNVSRMNRIKLKNEILRIVNQNTNIEQKKIRIFNAITGIEL